MQNTQLQEVLQKLGRKEIKSFSLFVRSPYFNKKNSIILFWEEVQKFAPDFNVSETEKTEIGERVSGKPYHDGYYRNLCSDLLELVENFLASEQLQKSQVDQHIFKNLAFLELGLISMLGKSLKTGRDYIEDETIPYTLKLQYLIRWDDFSVQYNIRNNRSKYEAVARFMFNNGFTDRIMNYSMGKIFLHILNDYRACHYLKKPFDVAKANLYLQIYENGLCVDDDYVKAYYLITKLYITKDDQYYFEVKRLILNEKITFPVKELSNIFVGIITYVFPLVELGEYAWRLEMFELYDYRLKNNLWKLHADLSYTSLLNIVQNSIMIGRIEYAEKVVSEFGEQLTPNIKAHVINLCNAWIQFYKGDFNAAHQLLLIIETENIVIKYSLRNLQAMLYFESGDYLVLPSFIDSFKHFINYNNEAIEISIKNSGLVFCNLLNQLVKLKLNPDKKYFEKLKNEIEKSACLMKPWLLQKI